MRKIFLDFDGTLVNSVKSIVELYNKKTDSNADWTKVRNWDFSDQCPGIGPMIKDFFASDEFYENLEFYDENTIRVLNLLKEEYEVIICTIGCWLNVSKKVVWIKDNAEHENVILIGKDDNVMDKSIIDMSGGIIIDDHEDNLFSSNADIKISFGTRAKWNENWDGKVCLDWLELEKFLLD